MKRIMTIALAMLMLACAAVNAATESTLRQPDNVTGKGKLLTATDATGKIALDVYIQGSAVANETALTSTTIATPVVVAAGATATYTLPGAADIGTYEINADAPFITYYAENKDANVGARMLLRSNEHVFVCEGNLCSLPTTIRFYNPDPVNTATYYIILRYQ
jgi:hypothetical protein